MYLTTTTITTTLRLMMMTTGTTMNRGFKAQMCLKSLVCFYFIFSLLTIITTRLCVQEWWWQMATTDHNNNQQWQMTTTSSNHDHLTMSPCSDDHRSPSGKFLPTHTCTCQNPYLYIWVQVPFLQVQVHTRSCGFANPYGFLLWVITINLYILKYTTNIIIRNIKNKTYRARDADASWALYMFCFLLYTYY